MLIRIKNMSEPTSSEITPKPLYMDRRRFITAAAGFAAGSISFAAAAKLNGIVPGPYRTDEAQTSYEAATTYNNFYEFGTGKKDPSRNAHTLRTRPWSVAVEGAVDKPGVYAFEDLIKPHKLEERIYRLRCVEAWSMVIPWVGIPLGDVIKRFGPTSSAKYVAFQTLHDPKQMPGQKYPALDWPYIEGLRMDEAMHPLAILAVGMYGDELPNQSGAPIRLVVPWKYGFKSIKSIVRMTLQETQPATSWNKSSPREYGFFSNVNPTVNHPRWSQAKERRIDDSSSGFAGLFAPKRDTLMFNGYADEVAGLYQGMDMALNY